MTRRRVLPIFAAVIALGCHGGKSLRPAHPATKQEVATALAKGLSAPASNDLVNALVVVPAGWKLEPLKSSDKHKHLVWLSPSGNTAYGVIYFSLPWPVGTDLALWGFLQQMKQAEGEATLVSKDEDDNLPGLRFLAQGKEYVVRGNLMVDGFRGWVVYAGTLRAKPVNTGELTIAVRAREATRVGMQ